MTSSPSSEGELMKYRKVVLEIANSDDYGNVHAPLCTTQREDGDGCNCEVRIALLEASDAGVDAGVASATPPACGDHYIEGYRQGARARASEIAVLRETLEWARDHIGPTKHPETFRVIDAALGQQSVTILCDSGLHWCDGSGEDDDNRTKRCECDCHQATLSEPEKEPLRP